MSLQAPKGGTVKPAILCLHGGGTNTMIFSIQTIRIQRALESHFEFVFLDAPFTAAPGPGVLPVFDGCGPFLRWVTETAQVEKPKKTADVIKKCLDAQREKDGRGFVGVLGFSQGARAAAGLLLEQQIRTSQDDHGQGVSFGVFLNGTCPPLTSELSESERTERIRYPSLSVVGLQDPWREDGRRLYSEFCDQDQAVLLEFDVGHRLPLAEQDTAKIAKEILRMHRETFGEKIEILNRNDMIDA